MKKSDKASSILKKLFKGINKINLQTKLPEILFNKNSTSDKNCNLSKNNLSSVLNKLIKCSTSKKKASLEDFYYHDEDGRIYKLDRNGRIIKEVANHLDHDVERPGHLNKTDNGLCIKQTKSQDAKLQSSPNPKAGKEKHPLHDFLKKMPNSNWKDWVKSNYDKNPENFTEDVKSSLEHYCGMAHIPDVADVRFTLDSSFEEGINILKEAEKQYIERTKNKKNFAELPSTAKKVLDFGDNFVWWDLGKPYCEDEGRAMGHCGNKASHKSYHTILSLRKEYELGGKKYYEPHLTFILDKEHGVLGEMKGRANEKPSPKYHYYIKELLKQPFIKMIMGGGYKPENNFHFSDLSTEHQKEVLSANPDLIYDTKSKDNLYKILMLPKNFRYCKLRNKVAKEADLSKIDSTVLENFLIDNHEQMCSNLCLNPTLPYYLMERLADHKNESVRYNLAGRQDLPDHLIEKLANDKARCVRILIASRQDITPKVMEILLQDYDGAIFYNLFKKSNFPSYLIEKIASKTESSEIHQELAAHPNTPAHLIEEYADHADYSVRSSLAKRPDLPGHIIEKLANDKEGFVRHAIARREDITPRIMEMLSQYNDGDILFNLAGNPNLPSHLIEKIAAKANELEFRRYGIHEILAANPNTPVHLMEKYASHGDHEVRLKLSQNPNLPGHLMEKLANYKYWTIRSVIAERQDITPKAAEILSQDNDSLVVIKLARNPSLPPHLFKILENSKHYGVKRHLEKNPAYIKWLQSSYNNSPKSFTRGIGSSLEHYSENDARSGHS